MTASLEGIFDRLPQPRAEGEGRLMDRQLEGKRDVIVQMLMLYPQVVETLQRNDVRGGGSWGLQMPKAYNKSFRELDRCLALLRRERRDLAAHVTARYLLVQRRNADVQRRGSRWIGLMPWEAVVEREAKRTRSQQLTSERVIVEAWPAWVRPQPLGEGVDWLTGCFRGEPFLPSQVLSTSAYYDAA